MKKMLSVWVPSILLFAACDNRQPYYDSEGAVSVYGLSVESESGNIGGSEIEISGAGFGSDISNVTVMFGNQNADVLNVTDSVITVRVPHGPVGGGAVDIRVGNSEGQDALVGGYTYLLPGNGIEPVFGEVASENQIAYVAVANDMTSCYGGTAPGVPGGCETFALTGEAGIEGRAEGLEIVYPGAEAPYGTGKSGFSNDTSISWGQWSVTTNPHEVVSFDDENAVQDFRLDIGEFSISNDANSGTWCANLPSLATFTYNGEAEYVPTEENTITGQLLYPELAEAGYKFGSSSVSPNGDLTTNFRNAQGCYEGGKEYALDELKFCMVDEYEEGLTRTYAAEWPIAQNFFMAPNVQGQMSAETPVPVTLNIPNANINQEIILPPVAKFTDISGENAENWALFGFPEECPDSDEDRLTTSADSVFNWTWEPVDWQTECADATTDNGACVTVPDGVKGVSSYVTVTISYLAFSWMGGEGVTQQATITVPDNNNFDSETGLSSLSLPTWVMYSFPTAQNNYGEQQGAAAGQTSWAGYGDQSDPTNGLVIIALDRKVEYTLEASIETYVGGQLESVEGDLVFAYSTGDMGYFSFDNPLDAVDNCSDCIDNDGDGWVDAQDPDCSGEGGEVNATTDSTCNDGIDNDGDGLIDTEDDNCVDGNSGESADCSNGIDDDGDGWIDQADPGCQDTVFEDYESAYTCNDGVDNDGDGWIDGEDLACTAATLEEDDGFADVDGDGTPDYTCNDGVDNDGNGDIDGADIYCFRRGPDNDEEPAEYRTICADGIDNDGDGWIDEADPSCELTNGNSENPATYDNTDPDFAVLGDCNDGIDNDCDGLIDAEDAGCLNAYTSYEADDGSEGSCNCGDGEDNDGDGWFDLDDPDCNGSEFGAEVGFVADVACNDDVDNDGDGLVDAFDVFCWERSAGAEGTSEAPSNPGVACDNGLDDDGDGWIDMADPSCEKTNGGSESGDIDIEHWGSPTCFNDGIDNDGDGLVDAEDTDSCANWYNTEE